MSMKTLKILSTVAVSCWTISLGMWLFGKRSGASAPMMIPVTLIILPFVWVIILGLFLVIKVASASIQSPPSAPAARIEIEP
jgi:hypothetical protein